MNIVAWNIQRMNNAGTSVWDASARAWWVIMAVRDMIVNGCQLIFLSETTKNNQDFGNEINGLLAPYGISVSYQQVLVAGNQNGVSPCSFFVIWVSGNANRNWHNPQPLWQGLTITPVGDDIKRPAIKIEYGNAVYVGVHLVANKNRSPGELADICNDFAQEPGVLILGDMNFEFQETQKYFSKYFVELQAIDAAGFTAIAPADVFNTHQSGKILDFGWSNMPYRVAAYDPAPGYDYVSAPDHRPIGFLVR